MCFFFGPEFDSTIYLCFMNRQLFTLPPVSLDFLCSLAIYVSFELLILIFSVPVSQLFK